MQRPIYRRFFFQAALAAAFLGWLLAGAGCADEDRPAPAEHGSSTEEHLPDAVELTPEMLERFPVRTMLPEQTRLPLVLETTGRVDFQQDRLAHVTPRIPGRAHKVFAELGDDVSENQILAIMDSVELGRATAEYLQAKEEEDIARQNYEREKQLYEERISSQQEMLDALASHTQAMARLRAARETLRLYGLRDEEIEELSFGKRDLSLLSVRAPIRGRIVEKHVTVGELLSPERSLFTLADLSRLWIWIDVYERDLRHVHEGDKVDVRADAFPHMTFSGLVTYLSDTVDEDTRTVRARIVVPNPENRLRPGMFVRIRVSDSHAPSPEREGRHALVVPRTAVQREGTRRIVFVALDDHRFQRREVTLGHVTEDSVEILSGLRPDERVVVEGAFLLKSESSKGSLDAEHGH